MLGVPTPFQQHIHVRGYRLSCLSICLSIHLSFPLSLCLTNPLFPLILFPLLTWTVPFSPHYLHSVCDLYACLWLLLSFIIPHLRVSSLVDCSLLVDKATFMVGSYGPRPEEYEFLTPIEEAPKGMLARGTYHNKSFFTDDDKHDHLTWEWNLSIKKEWTE